MSSRIAINTSDPHAGHHAVEPPTEKLQQRQTATVLRRPKRSPGPTPREETARSLTKPQVMPSRAPERAADDRPILECLRSKRDYQLIASDEVGGRLHCTTEALVSPGTQLLLMALDRYGPVRFYIEITGNSSGPGQPELTFDWIAVTATGRRSTLVKALREVLGLPAKMSVREDEIPRQQRLLYEAQRKTVRLVDANLEARPRLGRRLVTTRALEEGKFARLQVITAEEPQRSELQRVAQERFRSQPRQKAAYSPRTTPQYPMPAITGYFVVDTERVPMSCQTLGHTQLSFIVATRAPELGRPIELHVPGYPFTDVLLPIHGQVRAAEASGQGYLIYVDISARPSRQYPELVEYWRQRSEHS